MPLKILVTAKRVEDPESKIKVKPDGSGIVTKGVNYKMNPFDEIAVEEALRLKEKHGGEVVVASIGPDKNVTEVRAALAMGADRGILVKHEGPLDPVIVSALLAKVCTPVPLVVAARICTAPGWSPNTSEPRPQPAAPYWPEPLSCSPAANVVVAVRRTARAITRRMNPPLSVNRGSPPGVSESHTPGSGRAPRESRGPRMGHVVAV